MARLSKGETANSIQSISLSKQSSVKEFLKCFVELKENKEGKLSPSDIESYEKICSWIKSTLPTSSISINTLKRHIDGIYAGGWESFKRHRKEILSRGEGRSLGGKSYLLEKISICETNYSLLVDEVLMMCERHLDLLEKIQRAALTNEFVKSDVASHLRRFSKSDLELRVIEGKHEER